MHPQYSHPARFSAPEFPLGPNLARLLLLLHMAGAIEFLPAEVFLNSWTLETFLMHISRNHLVVMKRVEFSRLQLLSGSDVAGNLPARQCPMSLPTSFPKMLSTSLHCALLLQLRAFVAGFAGGKAAAGCAGKQSSRRVHPSAVAAMHS